MPRKVTPDAYYDCLPPTAHATGDIWTGLPSHGLLKGLTVRGLVVTPACDLMNRKVETITYIPLVPIREWFTSTCFLPDVVAKLNPIVDKLFGETARLPRYPTPEQVAALRLTITTAITNTQASTATNQALAAVDHISQSFLPHASVADTSKLSTVFGSKEWATIREKLVRNSLRTDTYFLPPDGEDLEWSGVPVHCLALFRYPMTAPIMILDAAADVGCTNWTASIASLLPLHPMATAFALERPVKHSRLRDRFFIDLLSKYLAVYARVGAPDFTAATVERYAAELGESL